MDILRFLIVNHDAAVLIYTIHGNAILGEQVPNNLPSQLSQVAGDNEIIGIRANIQILKCWVKVS